MPRLRVALLSVACLSLAACSDPPKPEKATGLDKIESQSASDSSSLGPIPSGPIAKVGEVEIPNEKFREIYDLKVKKYTDRGREIPTSADRRYRKSIAERLIHQEVLRQEAAAMGVDYDPKALEEREALQKRGISDWQKHLERRGETEQSLRDMYVAELREKAILEKLGKLELDPKDVDEDYEKIKDNWKSDKPRIRASQILVPIGPDRGRGRRSEATEEEKKQWEAEAKAKADELYAKVTAPGADFAEIAEENSTGPSAAKGGDIGIFTKDRMTEEVAEAAFKLKPGQISKPIKSKFGYHIIKVTGKWPPGVLPKDALEDQIVHRLEQRKLHAGRRELKHNLFEKYEIVDNIAPTLGPEPDKASRRSPVRRGGAMRNPHGRSPRSRVAVDADAKQAKDADADGAQDGEEANE